jgi:hypothetical protein
MDVQEFINSLKPDIRKRYLALTEDEKQIIEQNINSAYTKILQKILGPTLFSLANIATGLGRR